MILKAIHKDAASRYRTVDALIQDAQRFIAEEPLKAHPYSALYRTGKFIRRNRKSLSFVATMLGIIIALIVISMLELDRAAQRRGRGSRSRTARYPVHAGDAVGRRRGERAAKGHEAERYARPRAPLAESLGEDPIQQAEILTTIGSLYAHLGEYGKADALLHRAYGILAVRTPVSHDLSQVLMDLGVPMMLSRQAAAQRPVCAGRSPLKSG